MTSSDPYSPCVRKCSIGVNKTCTGCYRTIEEIAGWSRMTSEQKQKVLDRLESYDK